VGQHPASSLGHLTCRSLPSFWSGISQDITFVSSFHMQMHPFSWSFVDGGSHVIPSAILPAIPGGRQRIVYLGHGAVLAPQSTIDDEFFIDLPAETCDDIMVFASRAKEFEHAALTRSASRPRRGGRNSKLEGSRSLAPWSPMLEAYFSSKDTRELAAFRVWDFYGNPVLPRLVGKVRREVVSR